MRALISLITGLITLSLSAGPMEYSWWFDSDFINSNRAPANTGSMRMEIDASGLKPGVHTVHFIVTDEKGRQSQPQSQLFVRTDNPATATGLVSIDRQLNQIYTVPLDNSTLKSELDLRSLPNGIHTIQAAVKTEAGGVSPLWENLFMRVSTDGSLKEGALYVCVDRELRKEIRGQSADGVFSTELDLNDLENGLHTIQAFIKDTDGSVSQVLETVFMRVSSAAEISKMRCFYSIDNDTGATYEGKLSGNILCADIDASELSDGLHTISFMLVGENGETTQAYTSCFLKFPLGGVNLKSYSYWVNDKYDGKVTVNIDKPVNPYTLTALLPLEKQPFRSSNFHFSVEKSGPAMYTGNDFNLFLMDSRGYATLRSFPYYDATSRQDLSKRVQPFASILPQVNSAMEQVRKIESNDVRWYSFDAQKGDSIAFRLTTDCAYDIFAPDGSLLFKSTADKSRANSGAHTGQTGTHYIALHDQLGNAGIFNAILTRIDKYSILRLSPGNIASGGLIIFNMDGNGFENLKRVELTGNGISPIESDCMGVADWSFGMAAFDLTDRSLTPGLYTLRLHFDDNGKDAVAETNLAVHNLYRDELQVRVNPHNTSVADTRRIDVTIYNPSNTGYWGVPFNVARTSQDPDMEFGFKMIAYNGKDPELDPVCYDTDNLLGMGRKGRFVPMIIPYIGPKETLTYTFGVKRMINNTFDFYAWCGQPWSEELRLEGSAQKAAMLAPPPPNPQVDRNYNRLSRLQGTVNNVGGYAPDAISRPLQAGNIAIGIGCAQAGIYAGLDARRKAAEREAYSGLYDEIEEYLPHYRIPTGMTPAAILNNSGILPFNVPDDHCPYRSVSRCNQDAAECGEPRPTATSVQFPASVDPNDLIGYLSDAGSHYIGKDVKTLGYTIEFENDPEFATASAMTIRLEDKLDPKVFELGSFAPKELKIGNKKIEFEEGAPQQTLTLDMRPDITGIAQITLDYNSSTGQMALLIETINPYTMEPSDDNSQGVLPVNINGSGLGEFMFEVDLKSGLKHGTGIANKASIIFDANAAIETPVWENTADFISPASEIVSVSTDDDQAYSFEIEGNDTDSGIWKYELYVKSAEYPDWTLFKEGVTEGSVTHTFASTLTDPRFLSVAYDMAGNREENEVSSKLKGDLDGNGRIDANDLVLLYSYYIGRPVTIDLDVADLNNDGRIDAQDAVGIQRLYLGQTLRQALIRKLRNFRR